MSTQHNNGWVALTTRMPTKEDSNPDGYILVCGGSQCVSMACWDRFDACRTHWQPLPPPPETEEQKRARLDREYADRAWTAYINDYSHSTLESFKTAILSALAHARQPEARP